MSPGDDKDNPILQKQDTSDCKGNWKMPKKDIRHSSTHYVLLEDKPSAMKCGFISFVPKIPVIVSLVFVVVVVLAVSFYRQSIPRPQEVQIGSILDGTYTRKQSVTLQGSHVIYKFAFLKAASGCLPNTPEPCGLPSQVYEEWNNTIPDLCPDDYEDEAAYQANEGVPYSEGSCDDLISCSLKAAQERTTLALDDSLSCDRSHIFVKVRACARPGTVCLPYGDVMIKDDSVYTITAHATNFQAMLRPSNEEGEGIASPKSYIGFDTSLENEKHHNHWRFSDLGGNKFRIQNRGNGQWLNQESRSYSGVSSLYGNFNMNAGVDVTIPLTCDKNGLISNIATDRGSFKGSYGRFVVFDSSIRKHEYETDCGDDCKPGENRIGGPWCCASWLCLYSYSRCAYGELINNEELKFIIQEIRWEDSIFAPKAGKVGVNTNDYSEWASRQMAVQLPKEFASNLGQLRTNFLSNTPWPSERPVLRRQNAFIGLPLSAMKRSWASVGKGALRVVTDAAAYLPVAGMVFGVVSSLWEAQRKAEIDAKLDKIAEDVNKQIALIREEIDESIARSIKSALDANMDDLKNEGKIERRRVFDRYQQNQGNPGACDPDVDVLVGGENFGTHKTATVQLKNFEYKADSEIAYKNFSLPILRLAGLEYATMAVDLAAVRGFFAVYRKDCNNLVQPDTCDDIVHDINVEARATEFKTEANQWQQRVIDWRKSHVQITTSTTCPNGYQDCYNPRCCEAPTPPSCIGCGVCPCTTIYHYTVKDNAINKVLFQLSTPERIGYHTTIEQRYKSMLEWSMKNVGRLRLNEFNDAMDNVVVNAKGRCEQLYDLPENEPKRTFYVNQELNVKENMYQTDGKECQAVSSLTLLTNGTFMEF